MLARFRSRLTYANVVSSICLFVLLGGSAYAATQVGSAQIVNNSIRSGDIQNQTVRSSDLHDGTILSRDVKNGVLKAEDFKPGQLPKGPTGPQGPAGKDGADSAGGTGGGEGGSSNLPSGETLRGVYRVSASANNEDDRATSAFTFQRPLAAAPTQELIPQGEEPTTQCPGSPEAPTAAPGYLCVYEAQNDAAVLVVVVDPATNAGGPSGGAAGRFGAAVDAYPGNSHFSSSGSWAVTAP